jgi:Calcineurin-like phosphoesterase
MERLVYVVSDIHLGPGNDWDTKKRNPLEDFEGDAAFCAFLDHIGRSAEPVELVIAGDFLEYTQTLPAIGLRSPADNLGSTEEESLERTRVILGQSPRIASGHPEIFAALRRLMVNGHSITILAGNHDIDLLWPRVWAEIFDTIYPPGAAGFLQRKHFSYQVGDDLGAVYIEHGHEHDPANRFGDQMSQPFAYDAQGVNRLKRCWGTLFVDKVYNELERERWFIDNVKPILRVVKLGLRNDFHFTAGAIGLVVRFLLSSGLPPILGGGDVLGTSSEGAAPDAVKPKPASPPAEAIVAAVQDSELRGYLEAQMDDPVLRAELERAMRGLNSAEWAMIEGGAAPQASLDEAGAAPAGGEVLGGFMGGPAEDAYRAAAREVMQGDPRIATVIMGHTHVPIDGQAEPPLDLGNLREGRFFNSGTWTPHLRDEGGYTYSWQEIGDEASYTSSYTYVLLTPDRSGAYQASLHSWAEQSAELRMQH